MYRRETPDGGPRDALWLAVGTTVVSETGATRDGDDRSVRGRKR
ncbi:hypothetical protein U4E84_03145 [Halorubrum sp. AD140]|nr:hypothetical protein [Halorubrum sp. AD140]MDZ5810349.1 hypothetical protein [Halorubrum sp. AD140]